MAIDPRTGLPKNLLQPDTDPLGQAGVGLFGAAPSGGRGMSPTSPGSSYRDLLTIPGTQPDFLGILNSDPFLSQAQANLGAQGITDRAQRDALIRRALGLFGQVPDFAAAGGALGLPADELGGIANAETRALAEANTAEGLSTVGRLDRERERAQQNIMDVLAGRGALRSGATGIALKDLQQDYKATLSDAETQLLDTLGQYQSGFVQGQRERAMQLAQEQAAAAGRIDPSRLAGTPAREARHIGNGIYRDDQGNHYDVNGNPVAPPAVAPAPAPPQPNVGLTPQIGQRRTGSGGVGFQPL